MSTTPRWPRRTGARVLVVAALAVFGALAGVPAASAHAQLVGSTPGEGAVVDEAPATIELEFNESVTARPTETTVFTGDGAEVPAEVATADRTVTVTPAAELPEGTVVVGWAVTSADGHPIEGSITFAVGAPTPGASGNDAFDEPLTTGVGPAGAVAVLTAALAAVALAVLLVLGRSGRWLEAAWLVGLGAVVVAVPLHGIDRSQAGWAGLRDWRHWIDGWLTWQGLLLGVAVIAAACAVSWSRRGARVPVLVAVVALLVAAPAAYAAPGAPAPDLPQPGGSPVASAAAGDHTVRMTLDSVTAGTTGFRLEVLDASGEPTRPYAVPRVRATGDGLALDVPLRREAVGVWTGDVTLPQPGQWEMEVSVRLDKFTNPVATLPFTIGDRAPVSGGGH